MNETPKNEGKAAKGEKPAKPKRRLVSADGLPDDRRWESGLIYTENGSISSRSFLNACLIVENWAPLKSLRWNELRLVPELRGPDKEGLDGEPIVTWEPVEKRGLARIRRQIEQAWRVCFAKGELADALAYVAAEKCSYHPVKSYLDGLTWDAEDRISRILTEVLHAPNNELHQKMIRCWLIQCVRRVYQPGCQAQATLVLLTRRQGKKKTTFFQTLGSPNGQKWWVAGAFDHANKDHYLKLHRNWIGLLDELDQFLRNRDRAAYCAWLTEPTDDYRRPYDHDSAEFPRRFSFCGTTNDDELLRDNHGSRRFWIIEFEQKANIDLLTQWVDQIWAQAKFYAMMPDVKHWLEDEDDELREIHAERYRNTTELESKVEEFIADKDEVRLHEVLAAVLQLMTTAEALTMHREEQQVKNVLVRLGYQKKIVTRKDDHGQARQYRAWVRKTNKPAGEGEAEEPPAL